MLPTKCFIQLLFGASVLVSLETVLKLKDHDASRVLPAFNDIPRDTTNEKIPIPLFVRIPKTGSTSLLSFLHDESGMTLLENLISKSEWLERVGGLFSELPREFRKHRLRQQASALFCTHYPASYLESVPDNATDVKADTKFASLWKNKWDMQCQHESLQDLVRSYDQALVGVTPSQQETVLKPFTMMREPLARLRSLFLYVMKRCEHRFWAELFTEKQYETLCSGDYEQWLELVGNSNVRKRAAKSKKSPSTVESIQPVRNNKYGDQEWLHLTQYRFLHDDINEATAMVEGDSPAVLVLLNECYDTSLRIMEHAFALPRGAGDRFINSDKYHLNEHTTLVKVRGEDRMVKVKTVESPEPSLRVQELARMWFEEDYKLFDASVANFKRQMELADIDPDSLEGPCKAVLFGN